MTEVPRTCNTCANNPTDPFSLCQVDCACHDAWTPKPKFFLGELVRKVSGSSWRGQVVGTYSTALTPEGYCVESTSEPGSVQIYPAKALERWYPEEFV